MGGVQIRRMLPDDIDAACRVALLAAFVEMADAQASPAYLETDVDRNVALYEKFGFKVIDQEDISSVNNRFMWREAAAPATDAFGGR